MLNLQELIHDSDFCDTFEIIRYAGSTWSRGVQTVETTHIAVEGIVSPATSKDLELLPEGDRRNGLKTFYSDTPFRLTDTDGMSDTCIYRGQAYKLLQVFDYQNNGYYKAIGALVGDSDDV